MASLTYDEQSFILNGRRLWLLGASLHYARIPAEHWEQRIIAARRAGFNLIETPCPWLLHEPRENRFTFDGQADIARFIRLCAKHRMLVYLRPGPYIGAGYDGGGLPAWLAEVPEIALRENNDIFKGYVSRYFRQLIGEVVELQATNDLAATGSPGPILLIQCEHAWHCSNDEQVGGYLLELKRYLQESGITVPIVTANQFWQGLEGSIETWRGHADMLANLRQMLAVQPDAPRIVSSFDVSELNLWDHSSANEQSPERVMFQLGQALAAGGQPILNPFCGGTNFGFLGGRLPGNPDRFAATRSYEESLLREGSTVTRKLSLVKRLISFANSFSHVFTELDTDYNPVTISHTEPGETSRKETSSLSVVPLRGRLGRIVFVFSPSDGPRSATLLLDSGVRMPVSLGDQPLGWYAFDVDLHGRGRLDYASLCPYAFINRSILLLQGPAKAAGYLSINGSPLQAVVPSGQKPFVAEHKEITVVICNQEQIDATIHDDNAVYVGADDFDNDGSPRLAQGFSRVWRIDSSGEVTSVNADSPMRNPRTIKLQEWESVSAKIYVDGESPRYATLDGPRTLNECGATTGYGWYRMQITSSSARKRLLHVPLGGDRLHFYLDGELTELIGDGPGASRPPFELKLTTGDHTIVVLADNLGRFDGGNDSGLTKGLASHLYEIKPVKKSLKAKIVEAEPINPFSYRGFLINQATGQLSSTAQASWTFSHLRKTPIILEITDADSSGVILLNDEPIAYYAGASGARSMRLLLPSYEMEAFKRGQNVLRFAPDPRQEDAAQEILDAAHLYECEETLTEEAEWSFARWEPPAAGDFEPVSMTAARHSRGAPAWWKAAFTLRRTDTPTYLDTSTMSKGQAYVNGQNLGRYFSATATGRKVGPQTRLYIPGAWLRTDQDNELLIFDEHGCSPYSMKIVFGD